jgi:hypothetical protein
MNYKRIDNPHEKARLLKPDAVQLKERSPVGASLLAMVVNDAACLLTKRSALESIASKLAPTVSGSFSLD